MKIDVSDGEIVDKYSILCRKLEIITDTHKKQEVCHEKDLLHEKAVILIQQWPLYYRLLCHVNKQIWDKTDEIKALCPHKDPQTFAILAHEIFSHNDQRFRLKRVFNRCSEVKEQKSYADKTLHIYVPHLEVFQQTLDVMLSLVLDYDKFYITMGKKNDDALMSAFSHWFPPSFVSFSPPPETEYPPVWVHDLHHMAQSNVLAVIHDYLLSDNRTRLTDQGGQVF